MHNEETLKTEQVSKTLEGTLRLGPLNLGLDPGEILYVIGPFGSGKTTLLRLLWGFLRPDTGRISVFGMQPHLNQVRVRLKTGYVSANPNFWPSLTVKQHLRITGNFYEGWEESRTDQFLNEFGLDPNAVPNTVAPGERVKIALTSALGHDPALLIIDEPTSGLDAGSRTQILHFLKRLATNAGTSIVLSAELGDDLDHVGDSILLLNEGRVVKYARSVSRNRRNSRP